MLLDFVSDHPAMVTIPRGVAFAGANWRRVARSPRIRQGAGAGPKTRFAARARNPLAKFLQISKPAQAGFVPRCDTCAGLRLSAPLFLPMTAVRHGLFGCPPTARGYSWLALGGSSRSSRAST